jgi:glutathione S-transferase
MKLYEFAPTRSIRARWTLQELELDFDAVTVNLAKGEHHKPEFLAINPAAKLPVLVDGDIVLTESAAIVLYLAEKYPQKRLMPTDVRGRAELNRWLLFTVTELEQPLWRISKHTNLYPEADRIAAAVTLARRDFTQIIGVLDAHLRERPYVLGEHVSVGDFVLAYTLDWANELKLLDDRPTLRSYMERMYARPKAAMRIAAALKSVGLR